MLANKNNPSNQQTNYTSSVDRLKAIGAKHGIAPAAGFGGVAASSAAGLGSQKFKEYLARRNNSLNRP